MGSKTGVKNCLRWLVLLLTMALATPSMAAPVASMKAFSELSKKKRKKRKKKAKRYDKKAKKAFAKKQWDDAIAAFELAHAQVPEPKYLFNIGRCFDKKGDLYKAMEYTQLFVGLVPEGDEREDAEEMVEMLNVRLRKTSGEVVVKTTPPGATARLKGEGPTIKGKTPLRRWLPTGDWALQITLPDHETHNTKISIALGETSEVSLELVNTKKKAKAAVAKKAKAEPAASEPKAAKVEPTATAKAPATVAEPAKPQVEEPGAGISGVIPLFIGGTLLAGGAMFGVLAAGDEDRLEELQSGPVAWSELEEVHASADSKALLANILYVGGGIAVATGLILWLGSEENTATVSVSPLGANLRWSY